MMWNPFRAREREDRAVRDEVEGLEAKAARAAPAFQAQYLSRAGDLSASVGDRRRALDLWGRAIDSYLDNARPDAAAAACRKVILNVPEVVRARRTLALLSIGHGRTDEAVTQIREYVKAARRAGQTDLAVKQLRIMEDAAPDQNVMEAIRGLLLDLGSKTGGRRPRSTTTDASAAADTAHERWAIILKAARMSPDELAKT